VIYREALWRRLLKISGIVVILALYSSIVLVSVGISRLTSPPSAIIHLIFMMVVVFFPFSFIIIASCIAVIILPIVLVGQRMGYLNSPRMVLIIAVILGLTICMVTTGWFLGDIFGWLVLVFLGSSTGLLGGVLWWRWIGAAEMRFNLQKAEHSL
jgi:hypothetical protein